MTSMHSTPKLLVNATTIRRPIRWYRAKIPKSQVDPRTNRKMNLECHMCTENKIATSFLSLDDLQDHLFRNHHDGPSDVFQVRCQECDYRFGTEYRLLRHEQNCGRKSRSEQAMENIRHQLPIYDLIEESLKYNMANAHAAGVQSFEKMDLQCHECDADKFATSFCSLDELMAHMFSNHQAGPLDVFQFRCHKCDFKFGTEYRLLRHKETCGRESRSTEDTEKIRYKFQMYELLEESLMYNLTKPQNAGIPIAYTSNTETAAANSTSKTLNKKVGTVSNVKSEVQDHNRSNNSGINTQSYVKTEPEEMDTSEVEVLGTVEIRKRKAPSKSAEHIFQREEGIAEEISNLRLMEEAKKKRGFNSARDQEERMASLTSTAADMTNRIRVYGPCLHPTAVNPKACHKRELKAYFGQFGRISNVIIRKYEDVTVTFVDCDSAAKCLQQRTHKIRGQDFIIVAETPKNAMRKKLVATRNQDTLLSSSENVSVSNNLTQGSDQLPPGLTNIISVSGPCLYPEHMDPRAFQTEEFRVYFGQYGNVTVGYCYLYSAEKIADARITFDNWESVAKCLQQRTHKIRGQDFIVSQVGPEKPPATNLTNKIHVYGACLHPMEENPRTHQIEDLRTYFGQFGKIVNVSVKPIFADMTTDATVTFANCDSAAKCIEQGSHKILGQDFCVERGQPSKGAKKKIRMANLEQNLPEEHDDVSAPDYEGNLPEGLTNRIFVYGPCLHPEQVDPIGGQNGDLRVYFGQFGAILNISNDKCFKKAYATKMKSKISNDKFFKTGSATKMKSKVTFENCDSARQCLQQNKHKICGREFKVWAASPTQSMKKRLNEYCAIMSQNMPGPSTGKETAPNVQSYPAAESNFGNQWFQGLPRAIEDFMSRLKQPKK